VEEQLSASSGELLARVHAGVATVTLNRPAQLNALTLGMLKGLAAWLDAWEDDDSIRVVVLRGAGARAFCAGGDVRALYETMKSGSTAHHEFFAVEYALDFRIHTYPKTIVAVMDGVVMGGGMGLAQGARVRIVGERTRMAMPETAIGLFPDVGGSWFLPRVPGQIGTYLGLVGPTLRAADAIYCGLADLDFSADPQARAELEDLRPAIDEHFAHDSVDAIVASLRREDRPGYRDWAAKTLDALAKRSPTMLDVTLEQLRRGAGLSLADCFRMELTLIHHCFDQGDMVEGIRALIVDKDNQPKWAARSPAARLFEPLWAPPRHPLASLQPARGIE
jgi:enoyl-CoA hydratase/carnithine racemase